MVKKLAIRQFQKKVWQYYLTCKRDLPWRRSINPYRIFISEIMLQQTRAIRVIPKYGQFLKRFPNFDQLARSKQSEVLEIWSGLGYNRRAVMLYRAAKIVDMEWGGRLPRSEEQLVSLPGIGKNTAGAVLAYAFNEPAVFIETNIRSAFLHDFFPKKTNVSDTMIMPLVEQSVDRTNPREWYWALMDYGVMIKKQYGNPSRASAHHVKQSAFAGSNRQLRGNIVKVLLKGSSITSLQLSRQLVVPLDQIVLVLGQLTREGMVRRRDRAYCLIE